MHSTSFCGERNAELDLVRAFELHGGSEARPELFKPYPDSVGVRQGGHTNLTRHIRRYAGLAATERDGVLMAATRGPEADISLRHP